MNDYVVDIGPGFDRDKVIEVSLPVRYQSKSLLECILKPSNSYTMCNLQTFKGAHVRLPAPKQRMYACPHTCTQ